jgi:UDP-galactopyranose mutase
MLCRYQALANRLDPLWFAERLASHGSDNLDQLVALALATFERIQAVDRDGLAR